VTDSKHSELKNNAEVTTKCCFIKQKPAAKTLKGLIVDNVCKKHSVKAL
jgi:hypothetical protein